VVDVVAPHDRSVVDFNASLIWRNSRGSAEIRVPPRRSTGPTRNGSATAWEYRAKVSEVALSDVGPLPTRRLTVRLEARLGHRLRQKNPLSGKRCFSSQLSRTIWLSVRVLQSSCDGGSCLDRDRAVRGGASRIVLRAMPVLA
jgi:hypothetical protein